MIRYYARVPSAAIKSLFDGKLYALVPHRFVDGKLQHFSDGQLMRYQEPQSFTKGGEAYVWIGSHGDAIKLAKPLPFGVTSIHTID